MIEQNGRWSKRLQSDISIADDEFKRDLASSPPCKHVSLLCWETCFGGKLRGFTFTPSQTWPFQEPFYGWNKENCCEVWELISWRELKCLIHHDTHTEVFWKRQGFWLTAQLPPRNCYNKIINHLFSVRG